MSENQSQLDVSKILQPIENQTITTQTNKQKLTKEQIIEIAKTCQNKQEFYVKHKKLYDYCTYKGFRKEVMLHIPHKKKWTKESLIKEAKKYKTIKIVAIIVKIIRTSPASRHRSRINSPLKTII